MSISSAAFRWPTRARCLPTVSAALGPYLKRIPDGETGERLDWITWLEPLFAQHPAFEPSGRDVPAAWRAGAQGPALPAEGRRRRSRACASTISSTPTSPSDPTPCSPSSSAQGMIPAACEIPGRSGAGAFGDLALRAGGPAPRGRQDLQRRGAARDRQDRGGDPARSARDPVRHRLGGVRPARAQRAVELRPDQGGDAGAFAGIVVRLANHVPADIDLLFHFCYGDAGHKHVVEPTDMGDMVEFANRLAARVTRPIQLIHMPVPRDRSDAAYFEPLERLKLKPETELCLGLVHYTDGVAGTRRRLATARNIVERFLDRDRMRLRPARSCNRSGACCAFTPRSPRTTAHSRPALARRTPPRRARLRKASSHPRSSPRAGFFRDLRQASSAPHAQSQPHEQPRTRRGTFLRSEHSRFPLEFHWNHAAALQQSNIHNLFRCAVPFARDSTPSATQQKQAPRHPSSVV